MTTATRDQVQAFLDDLAALSTAHGLVLDADVGGHMSLGRIPAAAVRYGSHAARLRDCVTATWWEVGIAEGGNQSPQDPTDYVSSIDITKLSAHQRVAIRAALERVRAIVPGDG